jgi:subtilase family serine protease
MSIFQRSVCAPKQRSKRSLRPSLEGLEIRMALAGSTVVLDPPGDLPSIVVHPSFQRFSLRGTGSPVLQSAVKGLLPQSYSASSPSGYGPGQIRGAYGINNIQFGSIVGDGTGQTIAVVDAYDDPGFVNNSAPGFNSSDLARFDQQFGLPNPPSFQKLNQYGSLSNLPGTDPAGAGNPRGNWEIEEALDVEWAHAIAPGASIILVECNSNSGADMYQGVITAAKLPGVSVVSLSWGSGEFYGEQYFDGDFATPSGHQGVTFVASTGDSGSPGEYPAYSPNVVAAGGTSLYLNPDGSYKSESAWSGSGGGTSGFESEPAYQGGAQNTGHRTIPDVSFDADPNTGVAVYDSYNGSSAAPWEQIGGTSVSAPCLAALIAIVNQGRVAAGGTTLDGATQALPVLYSLPYSDLNDVTSGSNGGFNAGAGYDEVTGLGTPRVNLLAADLAGYVASLTLVVTAQPPSNVVAGTPFGLSVSVVNANGSVATNFSGSVTVAVASDPGGSILGGNLSVIAQNGVATFSGLSLTRAGTGYKLAVTASGATAAVSSAFSVTPAAATQLAVITQPPLRVVVNSPFGLAVAVEDRFGNVVTTYAGSVTVARASGPSSSTLRGTLTIVVHQGVATFSNLSLNQVGIGYSLKATVTKGLTSAKTAFFNVVASTARSVTQATRASHVRPNRGVHIAVKRARPHRWWHWVS